VIISKLKQRADKICQISHF